MGIAFLTQSAQAFTFFLQNCLDIKETYLQLLLFFCFCFCFWAKVCPFLSFSLANRIFQNKLTPSIGKSSELWPCSFTTTWLLPSLPYGHCHYSAMPVTGRGWHYRSRVPFHMASWCFLRFVPVSLLGSAQPWLVHVLQPPFPAASAPSFPNALNLSKKKIEKYEANKNDCIFVNLGGWGLFK